jgi:putative Mg2+ transporter-C (MgtC) family protein
MILYHALIFIAERQNHAQSAGLRTNALVALGTCLFMIISAYGFESFLSIPHIQVDPSRVASYVVAGIGFLGAGTIFRSQEVKEVILDVDILPHLHYSS